MHWSDTPKRALAFAKLPDSGEWLEDVRAGMSILTGTLVPIFSETKDGTEYTKLTSPDLCTVLVTWNLNVPYVCMYVCTFRSSTGLRKTRVNAIQHTHSPTGMQNYKDTHQYN